MDDSAQIQRVISRYSQFASRAQWDDVLATYLQDGVWEIPHLGMRFEGHDAIKSALSGFFTAMDYVLQMNAPALIEVAGNEATAHSNIHEFGKFAGRDEAFEFLGWYEDKLVHTPDGWKFAVRIFKHIGTHSFPLIAKQPEGQGHWEEIGAK
jgi:ketosteroid isomerase-like protein